MSRDLPHLLWPALVALLGGCTSSGPPPDCPAQAPPASPAESDKPPIAAQPAPKEAPVPDRFERLETLSFSTTHELISDLPSTLERSALFAWKIPWVGSDARFVALDQHPPRATLGRSLRVSDLLTEDEELAPGFHWLTFLERTPDGKLLVQPHAFSLEVEARGLPRAPGCTIFTPLLTFNGPTAADSVHVLVVPLVGDVDGIRLVAEGPEFRSAAHLAVGQEVRLIEPPSGDVRLTASCYAGEELVSTVERIITINRDAPEKAPP